MYIDDLCPWCIPEYRCCSKNKRGIAYDALIWIFWSSDENIFYASDGKQILNIYDYITTNDLYLFRHDQG